MFIWGETQEERRRVSGQTDAALNPDPNKGSKMKQKKVFRHYSLARVKCIFNSVSLEVWFIKKLHVDSI